MNRRRRTADQVDQRMGNTKVFFALLVLIGKTKLWTISGERERKEEKEQKGRREKSGEVSSLQR